MAESMPGRDKYINLFFFEFKNVELLFFRGNISAAQSDSYLGLNDVSLTRLPMDIGRGNISAAQSDSYLGLNDVSLTRLPMDIGSLSNLVSLEARDNLLKHLPSSMAELTKLQVLDLGSNDIDELVSDQKWIQTDQVRVPLIRAPHNVRGKFRFHPPHSVHVGGSYNLDTCVKPDVDILVLIPKGCLQSKDYLNHRYLRKRALYLACLAMYLRQQSMVESILFSYHHGNHLKPIAILRIKRM